MAGSHSGDKGIAGGDLTIERKCIGCDEIKNRDDLIKITKEHATNSLVINGNSKVFGRSAYLCYNKSCIENAFKKNKLQKILKTPISAELKGQLINEL
jgi:predicted RNA-binding protein YlxR (DUF448 family)